MYRTVFALGVVLVGINRGCSGQQVPSAPLRGPPIVEKAPVVLSSFLPASMQIMAHLTELMKYEIRPGGGPTTPTTTTMRPTPAHKPAIYAPRDPPGPAAYFARGSSYEEYVQRLKSVQGSGYFERYRYPVGRSAQGYFAGGAQPSWNSQRSSWNSQQSSWTSQPSWNSQKSSWSSQQPSWNSQQQSDYKGGPQYLPPNSDVLNADLDLLGKEPSDIIKQINRIDDDYDFVDDDAKIQKFVENYDDADVRSYIIGNKKVPPTRAYVTLLSLYDLLNKESKKLQLNKYGGYANEILQVLAETSTGSSASQLHTVLSKVVERRDVKDQKVIGKLRDLINDLEQSGSYINDALKYIPPLIFAL